MFLESDALPDAIKELNYSNMKIDFTPDTLSLAVDYDSIYVTEDVKTI